MLQAVILLLTSSYSL